MTVLILLGIFAFTAGVFAIKMGRSAPLTERHRHLGFFWVPVTILLLLNWAATGMGWPVGWSLAATLAITSFLATILGGVSLRVNTGWADELPSHLRRITIWALESHLHRFVCRSLYFQGIGLTVLHVAERPQWVYWILVGIAGMFLVMTIRGLMEACIYAMKRVTYVRNTGAMRPADTYDVFLSYRSVNANVVRQIAENLIAAGLRPWFAEYMIRFNGRDQFQAKIDSGIDSSHSAVLFTNDAYASSPHCETELFRLRPLDGLVSSLSVDRKPVLEVRIPDESLTYQKYATRLNGVPFVDFRTVSQTTEAIFKFINCCPAEATVNPATASVPGTTPIDVSIPQGRLSMQLVGVWRSSVRSGKPPEHTVWNSPNYFCQFGGSPIHFKCQLICDREIQPKSFHSRFRSEISYTVQRQLQKLLDRENVSSDLADRWLQESARDLMMLECAKIGAECHGVHLFWLWNRPHLSLTYWNRDAWVRDYLIRIPDSGLTLNGSFRLATPLRNLCCWTGCMDETISTITWTPGVGDDESVH